MYGVNITGVVIQQAFLRNGSELATPGITWGKSHTAVVSAKSVKAQVMGFIESIAREFANDFLSVNHSRAIVYPLTYGRSCRFFTNEI